MSVKTKFLSVLLPAGVALLPQLEPPLEPNRGFWHSPASFCTVANPELDATVRRRPNEFANVGSTTVTVTCAPVTDVASGSQPVTLVVAFENHGTVRGTAGCTIVAGSHFDPQVSFKQAKGLDPGEYYRMYFSPDEYGGFKQVAFTCTLPAGWSIVELLLWSREDVGA